MRNHIILNVLLLWREGPSALCQVPSGARCLQMPGVPWPERSVTSSKEKKEFSNSHLCEFPIPNPLAEVAAETKKQLEYFGLRKAV